VSEFFRDTFTVGSDTSLATYNPSWLVYDGASALVSSSQGAVQQGAGIDRVRCIYRGCNHPADQYAEIVVKSINLDLLGPIVRFTDVGGGNLRYYTLTADAGAIYFYWVGDAGSYGQLAQYLTPITTGTVIRLEVSGTTFTTLKDGVSLGQVTDSRFATGSPGFTVQEYWAARQGDGWIDTFSCGDLLAKRKILVF